MAKKAPASESTNREKAEQADSDIPASALLTERGMELVAQLKRLRYAEATLGSRHPSMPGVQEQIVSIRRILKSWGDEDESNASSRDEAGEPDKEIVIVSESVLDALSKDDLKQLVVRLAADVSKLRRRIDELQDEPLAEDEI
ncbi:hypothetical protein [Planctomycetes bacterium K23_9]|uniref:hypothetical protein n=1 Tax=Stieleria marina TaxID=1930275 RepID=UPI0011A8E030